MSPSHIPSPVEAVFRFNDPDPAIKADERSLFALAAPRDVHEHRLSLHDIRTAQNLPEDRECLHKHGFAVINHPADMTVFDDAQQTEEKYIPEIEAIVKNMTGCKTVLVNNIAFRRKPVNLASDPKFYYARGSDFDKMLGKLPTDRVLIAPSERARSIEPARTVHCDYTLEGLRRTIQHGRADFFEAGTPHVSALAAQTTTPSTSESHPPRIAAYSVWRPLTPIHRDPLAVLDYQTADIKRWKAFDYRASGYKGEYKLEAWAVVPPVDVEEVRRREKWYYASHMQPEEVMMVKFADSQAEWDEGCAMGCAHAGVEVVGQEGPTRESVEARVLAFW